MFETADVVPVVDVAGRRADHHERGEAPRFAHGGQQSDHRADRVAHEHHIVQIERSRDLDRILGVAMQARVLRAIVGAEVRAAGPDLIVEHELPFVGERRCDQAPHVLIAPEAVREHHRPVAATADMDVVALQDIHDRPSHARRREMRS